MDPDRLVLGSRSSWWVVIAVGAIGLFLGGDALVRGRIGLGLAVIAVAAFVAWIAYLVIVRPRVVVTLDSVDVTNPVTRTIAPWDAIERLSSRYQLRVHLRDGSVIHAWGAITTGRWRAPAALRTERPTPTRARGVTKLPPIDQEIAEWLADRRSRHADRGDERTASDTAGRPVVRQIEPVPLAITVALLVLAIGSVFLA